MEVAESTSTTNWARIENLEINSKKTMHLLGIGISLPIASTTIVEQTWEHFVALRLCRHTIPMKMRHSLQNPCRNDVEQR